MSNKSLLIVASLAYDGIETSEYKVDRTLGGAGSYICLSVKHFECNSSIISVVGNDFDSEDLELLKSCATAKLTPPLGQRKADLPRQTLCLAAG